MTNLTAKFSILDKMSDSIANIAQAGMSMVEQFERAESVSSAAFDNISGGAGSAATSVDGVATSINNMRGAAGNAASSTDTLTKTAEELSKATEKAGDEAEKSGKKGNDAIEQLLDTMASAGILKAVQAVTDELMEASAAAAQTETAFAKLQTIAGADSIGGLSAEIKELSADTNIAQDVLADVAYNAISAGAAVDEAATTAGAAAKLAKAGFTETSSALSVLSTAMNSYGDSAGTAMDISDSLITVQNLGVTTVAELSNNMGKAISTAAAYNVSLSNLESAYISTTKAGINTAESTTYISGMISELGKEGSEVANILREQTGMSFGQLMSSGYSLADVLNIVYDAAGRDAEAMMNLWGSQTAGVASAAIINQGLEQFNDNLTAIEESAGATENAYETMANTTENAHEKMNNSVNNLKIAVGDSLNPALEKLYNVGAGAFQWAADFAEEHPVVVKAITAVAIGVGTVAVAIAGFTFVTKVAKPALVSFGVALNEALGPIGWVALAITGIVAAGTALVSMMSDAEDETAGMTAVTRQQYYELQDLNAEYERACETYGENSEEALRLKYQVDDLSEAFENNRQTLEEFQTEVDELCTGVNDLWTEFDKNISEINATETGTLALIQKYEDLTEKTELTVGEQKQLEAVTKDLAEQFPDLTAQIDAATISTEAYIEAMRKTSKAEADKQRQEEAQAAYVEALKKQVELEEEIAKAEENLRLEKEAFNSVEWEWWSDQAFYQATGGALGGWTNDIDEYQAALDELLAAQEENNAEIAELEGNFEALAEKEKEIAEQPLMWQEAVSTAFNNVKDKIDELCAAYDKAYQAALESFEGQFGLFDEASTQSEEYMNSTVENAQKALDSQLAYWDSYNENIETLKNISAGQLGVTQESYDALMSYVQDGSEQAAGLASSMAEAIKNGDTEAVKNLANTIGDISEKQEEIAASTADWKTNFDTELKYIEREMKVTVRNLDLSDEAAASATSTIEEYADKIREGKSKAVDAANEVAEAVSAALLNASTEVPSGSVSGSLTLDDSGNLVPAHANGTTNAEDVFIAGESGPELIVGKQGSTVFPAEETERILNAIEGDKSVEHNYETVNADYGGVISKWAKRVFVGITSLFGGIPGAFERAVSGGIKSVPAHANGTANAENAFIAGENGPELIIGEQNSAVFPTEETESLVEALNAKERPLNVIAETKDKDTGNGNESTSEQAKRILLEVAGSGAIEINGDGKADKETILEILQEHLKPVLMNIIQSEIYEEGDLSYEY